jgi:hypothetical protein
MRSQIAYGVPAAAWNVFLIAVDLLAGPGDVGELLVGERRLVRHAVDADGRLQIGVDRRLRDELAVNGESLETAQGLLHLRL